MGGTDYLVSEQEGIFGDEEFYDEAKYYCN